MGVVSSTRTKEAVRFDSYLKVLKSDRINYLKTVAASSQPQNKEHFCPRIANKIGRFFSGENKRVIYNTVWKTSLIEQLKNLGNEGWPSLLLLFLKSWEHDATDLIYQSQVSWIDFNNNNSSKLIRSTTISNLRKGSGASKDGDSDYLPQEKEEEIKNEEDGGEKKLNEMLSQTDLLEENFYATHGHSSVKSSMNLLFVRDEKEEEEKKKSFSRSPQSKSFVQYKNNTFILPVLPNHSMNSNSSDHHKMQLENLYASVNYYKLVTGLIERHLQTSSNVFNQIIAKFTEFYVNKYSNILTTYSQSKEESQGEIYIRITSAVSDLQQFIRILFEGLNLFYNLEKLKIGDISVKENLFSRDNILNFLTSIVMSVPLYEQIFNLLRISDINTEDAFEKNLAASGQMSPQEMGVPPEYCLNKRTLEFYFGSANAGLQNFRIVKAYQSKQKMRSPTGKANQTSYQEADRFVETVMSVNSLNTLEAEASSAEKLIAEPFQKCIDTLKKIEQRRSPIHKMKTIVKTAELINTSIQSFYKAFNINKPFKLDSDQILSIFMYIVAKAGVKSLATQVKIIEKFATSNVLNSISGYYATTLEACINCIINLEIAEEESEKHSRVEFYDKIKNYLTKSGKI